MKTYKTIRSEYALPRSPTSVSVNVVSLFITSITFILLRQNCGSLSSLHVAIICFLTLCVSIICLEFIFLKPHKYASTGLDFGLKQRLDINRVSIKLLGFYATLAVIALGYWLFEEYHGNFYNDFRAFLRIMLPPCLLAAIPYFALIDRFMIDPKDSYWNAGMFFLGRWSKIDCEKLKQHFLAWMVKAFFLPLMFTYFVREVKYFGNVDLLNVFSNFRGFYDFAYHIIFAIDLLFVSVGYSCTIRLFDSHIRSTEPTLLGWFVALECYEPFWSFFSGSYFKYNDNLYWNEWLSAYPITCVVCGCIILFLLSVYVYATLPFGIRFSNLTNRGILTNGPYRFCKHPAYVSKNFSWWFISMPFLSHAGLSEAIRLSLLLVCVNVIYLLRARTEERHLSKDPAYVKYALAMNECSIFAWVGKLFPVLQFKPYKMFNLTS